jgi:hypothetical protein
MNCPGRARAVAMAFQRAKPVRTRMAVPQRRERYSSFSSKV